MKRLILIVSLFCSILSINAQSFRPPYPIIFVHGWGGSDTRWDEIAGALGGDTRVYDICLNHDGDLSTAVLGNDVYPIGFREDNSPSVNRLYAVNFDETNFLESGHADHVQSNESGIYKHGLALKSIIRDVCELENSDKVILVGHSMGGLSIREYLQRRTGGHLNSPPQWWVDPDSPDGHNVARVITIGTPHGGSNFMPNFFQLFPALAQVIPAAERVLELDISSEAVRDLRKSYGIGGIDVDGKYLYGGNESGPPLNFNNSDINCDGDETDNIVSLNSSLQDICLDNPIMPLPNNIYYTWITSDWNRLPYPIPGDIVVPLENQYLHIDEDIEPYGRSDTLLMHKFHLDEPEDVYTSLRGLDEPDDINFAYEVNTSNSGGSANGAYFSGLPSIKPNEVPLSNDKDYFFFHTNEDGIYRIDIANLLNQDFLSASILDGNQNYLATITSTNDLLEFVAQGYEKYYLELSVLGHTNNWDKPYSIRISRITEGESVQVAISIDKSGSMYGNYMSMAKSASNTFVDLMQHNDYLAITSFSYGGGVNFPFTQLSTDQDKVNAKNAINSISPTGSTSIGAGLQIAQNELNKGDLANPQGMILISDGYENRSPYVSQILPTIPGNTDIYTVALGTRSDENLLNSIAASTGGFYSYAPNTERLSLIYNTIKAKVTGQQTVDYSQGLIAVGQTVEDQANIDAGASMVEFVIIWPGSDLDLELVDPLGNVIGHDSNLPNISFTEGSTFEKYTVLNPIPGLYTLRITGIEVTGLLEEYQVSVSTESSLHMSVDLDKDVYGRNEPMLINAAIRDGIQPVTNAKVQVEVSAPGSSSLKSAGAEPLSEEEKAEEHTRLDEEGSEGGGALKSAAVADETFSISAESITLFDDGQHGDGAADDGVYGNYYSNTYAPGSYSFDVSASGSGPSSGDFSRFLSKSTIVTNSRSILVTEPQTGTTWFTQTLNSVEWSSTNLSGNVDIYLSLDGGNTFTIPLALNTPDDGSEEVLLPSDQSTSCRIRVRSVDFQTVSGQNPGDFIIKTNEKPTTLIYSGDFTGQYSDEVMLTAILTENQTGLGIPGQTINFDVGNQSVSSATDSDGIATATIVLDQAPALTNVECTFGKNFPYSASIDSDPFIIEAEDVIIEYSGLEFQATPGARESEAVIELRAVLRSVPDGIGFEGDIRNACISFKINGQVINSSALIPGLINPGDITTGIVIYNWTADIGNADYMSFDLEVITDCCYKGSDQSMITVYKPSGDFITGGGHIISENSSGTYASTPGQKTNFGFHVKFNKSGKNLQGGMNIILRRMESDGLHLYKIKTNSMTSLGVDGKDEFNQLAVFTSKANLRDLTSDHSIGNLQLIVNISDKGEPGRLNDQIGISLWDRSTLLYTSNWGGIKTIDTPLEGGNLVVHSGFNVQPAKAKKSAGLLRSGDEDFEFEVHPNPFTDRLYFNFVAPESNTAVIDIYDITGRKIETIFTGDIEQGTIYNFEYSPRNLNSGILIYQIVIGEMVNRGTIIHK